MEPDDGGCLGCLWIAVLALVVAVLVFRYII